MHHQDGHSVCLISNQSRKGIPLPRRGCRSRDLCIHPDIMHHHRRTMQSPPCGNYSVPRKRRPFSGSSEYCLRFSRDRHPDPNDPQSAFFSETKTHGRLFIGSRIWVRICLLPNISVLFYLFSRNNPPLIPTPQRHHLLNSTPTIRLAPRQNRRHNLYRSNFRGVVPRRGQPRYHLRLCNAVQAPDRGISAATFTFLVTFTRNCENHRGHTYNKQVPAQKQWRAALVRAAQRPGWARQSVCRYKRYLCSPVVPGR